MIGRTDRRILSEITKEISKRSVIQA